MKKRSAAEGHRTIRCSSVRSKKSAAFTVFLERQFRRYYRAAVRRPGLTGSNLLSILETRLDNVIYRMGFADSRAQARQLVSHGHFEVNGRRTDVPSLLVTPGDKVEVRSGSRDRVYFKNLREAGSDRLSPDWVKRDLQAMNGEIIRLPERSDIDLSINDQLVVEYYSR